MFKTKKRIFLFIFFLLLFSFFSLIAAKKLYREIKAGKEKEKEVEYGPLDMQIETVFEAEDRVIVVGYLRSGYMEEGQTVQISGKDFAVQTGVEGLEELEDKKGKVEKVTRGQRAAFKVDKCYTKKEIEDGIKVETVEK